MPSLEKEIEVLTRRVGPWVLANRERLEQGRYGEATILFADLAGFTSLTEIVSTPEELVDIINLYANEIVTFSQQLGGHLESWAGDAGIIRTNPFNAVLLARHVDDLIQKNPLVQTVQGEAEISFHSGIGTGEVFEAVVGTQRRKYVVIGDAVDRADKAGDYWQRGQTLLDQQTLERLGEAVIISATSGGYCLLEGIRDEIIIPATFPPLALSGDPQENYRFLRSFFPVSLPKYGTGRFGNVTNVFMDFPFLGELFRRRTPTQELKQILDYFFDGMVQIVEGKYGGVVDKLKERYSLLTFGSQRVHGDDEYRGCFAVNEVKKFALMLCQKLGIDVLIPAGISTGRCYNGLVAGTSTSMGDPVNVAARILKEARKTGKTLIDVRTVKRLGEGVRVREGGRLRLEGKERFKGKSVETEFYELEGVVERERKHLLPLYGRDKELQRVKELISEVKSGRGIYLGIKGEAGMGKSRFLVEVNNLLEEEFEVYTANCSLYDQTNSFQPFRSLLEQIVRIERENSVEEVRRKLENYFSPEKARLMVPLMAEFLGYGRMDSILGEKEKTRKLREGIKEIVTAGESRKTIIVSDAHWADKETKELLDYLRRETEGVFLVADYRPGAGITPSEEIELGRLGEEGLLAMLSDLLQRKGLRRELEPTQQQYFLRKSKGNPLFLQEIVKKVEVREGKIYSDLEKLGIPETVEALIGAEIDELGEEERRALEVLSVLGDYVDSRIAEGILGERIEYVENLVQQGWVHKDTSGAYIDFFFHHSLFQEVAYDKIRERDKKILHGKAAKAYEKFFPECKVPLLLSRLARHYCHSNLDEGEIVEIKEGPVIVEINFNLARAIEYTHRFNDLGASVSWKNKSEGYQDLEAALKKMKIPRGSPLAATREYLRGKLHLDAYQLLINAGENKSAKEELDSLQEIVETAADPNNKGMKFLRGRFLHAQAGIKYAGQQFAEALGYEEEAEQIMNEVGSVISKGHVQLYQAIIYITLAGLPYINPKQSDEYLRQAVCCLERAEESFAEENRSEEEREELSRKKGRGERLRYSGVIAKLRRDYSSAVELYREAEALYERNGFMFELIMVNNDLADLYIEQILQGVVPSSERLEFAGKIEKYSRTALEKATMVDNKQQIAFAAFNLGAAYVLRGEREGAEKNFGIALSLIYEIDSSSPYLEMMWDQRKKIYSSIKK